MCETLHVMLRLLSADNGMDAEEATSNQESSLGLQWGPSVQNGASTLKKKKSVAVNKQPKDSQVGSLSLHRAACRAPCI